MNWGAPKRVVLADGNVSSTQEQEMKKILLIAFHFPPDAAIGAVRPAKFAKYLPEFGWEPIIYTLKERFYERSDYDKFEPALKGFKIYRGTLIPGPLQAYSILKESMMRSHVVPGQSGTQGSSPVHQSPGRFKGLLGSLLRLPDENQGWVLNIAIEGYRISRQQKVDAFFTSGPPMSTHIGGALLKSITGIKWVADFRDPWVAAPWEAIRPHTRLTRYLNGMLESWVVHNADIILTTTESTAGYFKSIMNSGSKGKCVTIPNGYDDDDFGVITSTLPQKSSKIKVVYTGSLYANRNPEPFFAALQALVNRGQLHEGKVEIELIGNCSFYRGMSVHDLSDRYGLGGIVRILDEMPYQACLDRMINANALLLFAQGQPDQIPGKVFEYLRINRPIFAIAEEGETKKILEPISNAFVINPEDIEDIGMKFLKLLDLVDKGVTSLGLDFNIKQYSRRELTKALVGLLES